MVKKGMCLGICLLLVFGCAGVQTKSAGQITLAPAAAKTVCIQTDPAKPDTAVIVQPLEAQLTSKGYRIVATPKEASYTMQLRLAAFGLNASRPSTDSPSVGNAPVVLGATGTAIGSAASTGNVLHTTSTGGTTGGLIGFGTGVVVGSLLGSDTDHRKELYNLHVPFNAEVDVIITESSSGRQQGTTLAAWQQVKQEGQAPAAREAVVSKMAAQISALMP